MHSSHPHTTFTFTCSSKSQQFLCCQRKEDKITKNYDLKIVTADHNQNNLTKSTQSDKKKKGLPFSQLFKFHSSSISIPTCY